MGKQNNCNKLSKYKAIFGRYDVIIRKNNVIYIYLDQNDYQSTLKHFILILIMSKL